MIYLVASNTMRTTLDIDEPVLTELKNLRRSKNQSLGKLASELLASALAAREALAEAPAAPKWNAKAMGAKVDLDDKEAVYAILDEESP